VSRRAKIVCTLGPASFEARTIRRLEESGASLFRINLSHTRLGDLRKRVQTIRAATLVPICLDTEGAQIRTGEFLDDRRLPRIRRTNDAHDLHTSPFAVAGCKSSHSTTRLRGG
jgi:pyruvate kinase